MTESAGDWIRVEGGRLDDDELAAVVAVVSAVGRQHGPPRPDVDSRTTGGWVSYFRTVRRPVTPGTDAWRTSLR